MRRAVGERGGGDLRRRAERGREHAHVGDEQSRNLVALAERADDRALRIAAHAQRRLRVRRVEDDLALANASLRDRAQVVAGADDESVGKEGDEAALRAAGEEHLAAVQQALGDQTPIVGLERVRDLRPPGRGAGLDAAGASVVQQHEQPAELREVAHLPGVLTAVSTGKPAIGIST